MKYTPIRQRVIEMLQRYEKSSEEWVGGAVNVKVDDHVDIIATLRALESDDAKTIIVPAEQALALLPAAKRFEEHLDFHLPFECCVFQFDQPIPKETLRLLACAIVAYINCENVTIEKGEEVPEKVNRKREKEGKRRIDPYYVVKIRHEKVEGGGSTGLGTKHSFRYDVRGHFRRMTDGKLAWVRAHQRGLSHEFYVPNVYKV